MFTGGQDQKLKVQLPQFRISGVKSTVQTGRQTKAYKNTICRNMQVRLATLRFHISCKKKNIKKSAILVNSLK